MAQAKYTPFINMTGKLVFLLTLVTAAFWLISKLMDVYKITFVGIVFEILWLPILALTFILPLFSGLKWVKSRYACNSFYLYSLYVSLAMFVFFMYAD